MVDVVLRLRPSEYGPWRIHPNAATGHGCVSVLLLRSVEIGALPRKVHRDASCCGLREINLANGEQIFETGAEYCFDKTGHQFSVPVQSHEDS